MTPAGVPGARSLSYSTVCSVCLALGEGLGVQLAVRKVVSPGFLPRGLAAGEQASVNSVS